MSNKQKLTAELFELCEIVFVENFHRKFIYITTRKNDTLR